MTAVARALASLLAAAVVLSGCGNGGRMPPRPAPSVRADPTATAGAGAALTPPNDLSARLLRRGDVPAGFMLRPLTSRNLPSSLTGCRPLEKMINGGVGRHKQVEFFRPPVGPWIDEAVILPSRAPATELAARLAKAIERCDSVTVTEEGQRVALKLSAMAPTVLATAVPATVRDALHVYRATGELRGIGLSMQITLLPAGALLLLITTTALATTSNPALTNHVVRAAVERATRP